MHQPQQRTVIVPVISRPIQQVGDFIPTIVPVLLAVFQLILCVVISALEAVSVYYDAGRGTIYAGFWCSCIFTVTWIAMFSFIACRKSNGCGSYLIVQNIINGIFAVILIIFTALFIDNVCLCYGFLCNIPSWDSISDIYYNQYYYNQYKGSCTERTFKKLPILKALLSFAVLMLVTSIIFIIVYIIAYIRFRKRRFSIIKSPPEVIPPYQPSPMVSPINTNQQVYQEPLAPMPSAPHYYATANEAISNSSSQIRSMKF